MEVCTSTIPDIVIINPTVHRDERGFFLESFNERDYEALGIPERFVQDNHSLSKQGTVRGLHLQSRRPQGKLIRATRGEILDVAVDVRVGSPTFAQWAGTILSADNFRTCYIPSGFAHGFCVLSEWAEIQYKCTDYYDPDGELTIAWDDPEVRVDWALTNPTLSVKDANAPTLANLTSRLPIYGPF